MASIEEIKQLFETNNASIGAGFESLRGEMKDFKEDIKQTVSESLKTTNERIEKVEEEFKIKLKEKDDEIKELRLENERQKRRRNLILYNFLEKEQNGRVLKELVVKLISEECKVDIGNYVDFIFRIGKQIDGKTRPILIAFTSFDKKMDVMWNRKRNNSKIELADDFCKEDSDERRKLAPIVMELRNLNYKNVHLKYDKLYVDGVECKEEKWLQLISEKQATETCPSVAAASTTDELNKTMSSDLLSGNAKINDIPTKRVRTGSDEDSTPTKTPKSANESRTTIIGTDNCKNNSTLRNPIKDALKKQMALSPLLTKKTQSEVN